MIVTSLNVVQQEFLVILTVSLAQTIANHFATLAQASTKIAQTVPKYVLEAIKLYL